MTATTSMGTHTAAPGTAMRFGHAFVIGIALNLAYVAAEAFYGVAAHSVTLLADAGHNLGDALGNAVTLLVITGAIAWEAIRRLIEPEPTGGATIMVVAAVGIAVNGVTALLFTAGRKDDVNIRGAFLHMASATLVALGVVVAGGLILLTGWQRLDPAISLLVSAVIVAGISSLLDEAVQLSLDAVPERIDRAGVASYLNELPGIAECTTCTFGV